MCFLLKEYQEYSQKNGVECKFCNEHRGVADAGGSSCNLFKAELEGHGNNVKHNSNRHV